MKIEYRAAGRTIRLKLNPKNKYTWASVFTGFASSWSMIIMPRNSRVTANTEASIIK